MEKKVDGVQIFSNSIRNDMLKKNLGKYSQWTDTLVPAIGESYNIPDYRPITSITQGKSLLDYTIDGKSDYSKEINRRYFGSGRDRDIFEIKDLTQGEIDKWTPETQDYIQYLDEVLGKDVIMRHVDYINNFLSGQYIENALRQTEVGVIKDINVSASLQGVMVTNPNNMSGKDTRLGAITNYLYAKSLYNGAIFNSDRERAQIKVGGFYFPKTYITPYLVNQYGNNTANVYHLSDIMSINTNEAHIREDLGAGIQIIDDINKDNNPENNAGIIFYNQQLEEAEKEFSRRIYTPYKGESYVNLSKKVNDPFYYLNGSLQDDGIIIDDFYVVGMNKSGNRWNGKPIYSSYDERDNVNHEGGRRLEGSEFEDYSNLNQNTKPNGLLVKTNQLFNQHKIGTMVGRFYSGSDDEEPEFIDSAKSPIFGNSHGRNLLKRDVKEGSNLVNGYDNPYCRTWTYHHQYHQMKNLIRPFVREETIAGKDNIRAIRMSEIQGMNRRYRAYSSNNGVEIDGGKTLSENTVLQDNGMVRITPKIDANGNASIKNCMFSIENLAWKDVLKKEANLSPEQQGPNGGRIMWFPPYDLDFQESVNVNWNENSFIGRGEKVYTYTDTMRSGTLSFSLLIDHPVILNSAAYSPGMGEEKDAEADILRFMAGCELFDLGEEPEENGEITEGTNEGEKAEPQTYTLKFKVYFPNNFSGIYGSPVREGEQNGNVYRDFVNFDGYTEDEYNSQYNWSYWWRYLLTGVNAAIPSTANTKFYRGYEIKDGTGLTYVNEYDNVEPQFQNNVIETIPTCISNAYKLGGKLKEDGFTCQIGTNTNEVYAYHVDSDLNQVLKIKENYKDKTSTCLNSNLNEREENEYTFTEILNALIKSTDLFKKEYGDYLDTICTKKEYVNNLVDIFKNPDMKFKELKVTGGADGNDSNNINKTTLAARRAYAIKIMFEKFLNKDLENIGINSNVGSKTGKADSIDVKKERCCSVELVYTLGEPETRSKVGNTGQEQVNQDENLTFEEYYNILLENSPLLHKIDEIEIVKRKVRAIAEVDVWKGNQHNYSKSDFKNDKNKINTEISILVQLLDGYEFIVLACGLSDTTEDCNDNFARIVSNEGNKYYDIITSVTISYSSDYFTQIAQYTMICNVKNPPTIPGKPSFFFEFPYLIYKGSNENEESDNKYEVDLNGGFSHYLFVMLIKNYFTEYFNNSENYEIFLDTLQSAKLGTVSLYETSIESLCGAVSRDDDYETAVYDAIEMINNNINRYVIPKVNEAIEMRKNQRQEEERMLLEKKAEEQRKKDEEALANFENDYAYGLDRLSNGKRPDNRYETEAEYFKTLKITDPILFKHITDKFKYFNPAYHSMSPEGFNARLTFLHQCTRQGMTIENRGDGQGSNENGGNQRRTAANLAFGRQPVCIIRIGDFIHTRAIIQSMSINYAAQNGIQWDLNPEGSGVQPMYAKISLQIVLLGGQSLGAPISRLQNAISFNYYANTEVYDNRSDVAYYISGGTSDKRIDSVEYRRVWSPLDDYKEKIDDNTYKQSAYEAYQEAHKDDASWNQWNQEKEDKASEIFNPTITNN